MSELGHHRQRLDHGDPVAPSPLSRGGNVGNVARWFVDDAHHSSSARATFPGGPSVAGTAVDVANGRIPVPRQESVAPRFPSTSELAEGSVSQVDSHPWPIRTSKPSLRLRVLKPRLDERELVTSKGPKFHGHRNMVSSSRGGGAARRIVPKGSRLVLSPRCPIAAFPTGSGMESVRERDGVARAPLLTSHLTVSGRSIRRGSRSIRARRWRRPSVDGLRKFPVDIRSACIRRPEGPRSGGKGEVGCWSHRVATRRPRRRDLRVRW
jgi:hypothetical protein